MSANSMLAAKQVATRNILAPLLWLSAIMTPTSFAAAYFATGVVATVLLVAGLVPPGFALLAYAYWTFKDANRLQSEEFVLQQRWMDNHPQIGDNRTREVIDLPPQQSQLAANTAHMKGK